MVEPASYIQQIIASYEQAAPDLVPTYRTLSPETVLAPAAAHLPAPGACVLDVGAGPGINAAWLAERGCRVTAVEPVAAFRAAGHDTPGIQWQDDHLPRLATITQKWFDAVLAIGVLHHLTPPDQTEAIKTISQLLRPGGKVILSLRHGPCPPDRAGFAICVEDIIKTAEQTGLQKAHLCRRASIQDGNRRAGVTWTWAIFARTDGLEG
ncbi:class I SAM-dependent methyltransferase [Ruegeria sp.]|uniref:class I SAM-dependent methyltransferase n=1 Tax=Ruegeria sp. TaxID=1879320 RepID=UPI00231331FE|nr:class I SAM-dependent methyltransferase [Ruegeria sp.]MDA7966689.1 class I SAM-dependent methyltransferase [Ruegeria sp.]